MRLCVPIPCHNPSDTSARVCAAIRTVAALGYDAVELYDWRMLDPDEVNDALRETGVELVSMLGMETRLTDPAYRESWLTALTEACAAAAKMGVRRLITQHGSELCFILHGNFFAVTFFGTLLCIRLGNNTFLIPVIDTFKTFTGTDGPVYRAGSDSQFLLDLV